jgi:hypothetical protein
VTKEASSGRRLGQSRVISIGESDGSAVEPDLNEIFGPPPILEGEREQSYKDLYRRVRAAIGPIDVIEEIWVRDITDLSWETFRLRRLKAGLLALAAPDGMKTILQSVRLLHRDRFLRDKWAKADPKTRKEVDKILSDLGLDSEAVMAQTLAIRLDDIERIDHLTMQAETRRNAALREIDRRRGVIDRLQTILDDAEEAEFEQIEPASSDQLS